MDANEQHLPPLPHYDDTSCGGEGMFTAQTMCEYAIAAFQSEKRGRLE